MEITDIKVRLVEGTKQKVRAFCTVIIDDCFVVKDVKVIQGDKGEFIAMPSRKLSERCERCGRKNPVGASYCNSCGAKLPEKERVKRTSLYSDIVHPITSECRSMMQEKIVKAYHEALEATAPMAELVDEEEPKEAPPPPRVEEPKEAPPPPRVEEPPVEESSEPEQEQEKEGEGSQDSFSQGIC